MSSSVVHFSRALSVLTIFLIIRYQGDNSLVCLVTIAMAVIATVCHVILEIKLGLDEKGEKANGESNGQYVLLDQPNWLPEVNPTHVNQDSISELVQKLPLPESEEYEHLNKMDK